MPELTPAVLKLDGLSRVPASSISDRDYRVLDPGVLTRTREKIFQTYRVKAPKTKVENLADTVNIPEKPLILNTRGTYHHLTYGFLQHLEKNSDKELGYVHVDNHTDTYLKRDSKKKNISSGSFVSEIYELENISDLLFVGCSFEPFDSIDSRELQSEEWREKIRGAVKKLPENIYISVDLDVFPPLYISCPFGQGETTYRQFHFLIEIIREKKNLIGADICGIDRPHTSSDRRMLKKTVRTLTGEVDQEKVDEVEERARENIESLNHRIHRKRYKHLLSHGDS